MLRADGERVGPGDAVLRVSGPAAAVLGAERTMLNFLTHLSGDRHRDPGLGGRGRGDRGGGPGHPQDHARAAGAREVRGAVRRRRNHRMGLGDAALIKDNHVAAAGGVAQGGARRSAGGARRGLVLEVECDSLAQVREALEAGARFLLLDNMPLARCARRWRWPAVRRACGSRPAAGCGWQTPARSRQTGVDYLAVGALTHSCPALDLGLDFARCDPDGAAGHVGGGGR